MTLTKDKKYVIVEHRLRRTDETFAEAKDLVTLKTYESST